MAGGTRSVPTRSLRDEAELLSKVVLGEGLASPEEIASYRPGKENNPNTGATGWLRCLIAMHRFHARAQGSKTDAGKLDASQQAVLLDALRGASEAVVLVARGERTERRVLHVHPKSFDTLMAVEERDQVLRYLTAHLERLRVSPKADDLALCSRVMIEIVHQYRVLAWIVTHEGPGMPFAADEVPTEVPAHVADLDPADYFRLQAAWVRVNQLRLHQLRGLLASDAGEGSPHRRPEWPVLVSAVADEMKLPSEVVMRDFSLPALLARVHLAAVARKSAADEATARQGANAKG